MCAAGGCAARPGAAGSSTALLDGARGALGALDDKAPSGKPSPTDSPAPEDQSKPHRERALQSLAEAAAAGRAEEWIDAQNWSEVRGSQAPLITAYAALSVRGRREPEGAFRHPLYRLPLGRESSDPEPWLTRSEIERTAALRGRELVWLDDELTAYLAHVNGSVEVLLPGNEPIHLAHSGTNGRPYSSLARLLTERALLGPGPVTLASIRALWKSDPASVRGAMRLNERFVFFEEVAAECWPRASTGVALVPAVSAAADPEHHPLGSILLIELIAPPPGVSARRLAIVHDTGGAIRGAGRIDLYLGAGEEALRMAGEMACSARVWTLASGEAGRWER